jgi:NAD(P)-dependent dehydrogenase (short-subunit alcohol dehydrogenase family)
MPFAARRTALVTGASRGIGKATAIVLAGHGFDVAVTARTVHPGDPTSISPETGQSLPGSLDETCAAIEAAGGRSVPIAMDLLDRSSLEPAVATAIAGLGHIEVLVNNAIFVGAGAGSLFLDTSLDDLEKRIYGNLTAQLHITHHVLRHMIARGSGTIVDVTSGAGRVTPPKPAGQGGWALGYAASKAGFHRIADMVALEYGGQGIRAFNINPGFVATERVLAAGAALEFVASQGVAPEVVGEAIAWLVDSDTPNGAYVQAQEIVRKR